MTTQKESIEGTASFNEEELFYLNRILFRLFKKKGFRLRFDKFIKDVTTLQTGTIAARLTLWLNCICEMEEDVSYGGKAQATSPSDKDQNVNQRIISKQKFSNVIRASFPQDVTMKTSFEVVVDKIFSNGLDDVKTIDKLHSFIMGNPEALGLISCILQYEDDAESEGGL